MSIYLVPPVPMNDTVLAASNVPETDYAAYAAATTYNQGDRCIRTSTHTIYESLVASNLGNTPETSPTKWIAVSPTNRWKMFDSSNTTATTQASPISVTLTPGQAVTVIGLMGLVGSTARVRVQDPVAGTVYDNTVSIAGSIPAPDWSNYFFGVVLPQSTLVLKDLPPYPNASILIDIAGPGNVQVATCVLGYQIPIGATDVFYGARVGIQDYSGKTTSTYGDTVFTKRAYAKRANFELWLAASEVDGVQDLLAAYRATPALWVGSGIYGALQIFGFYRNFDITIAYPTYSVCQLEIEGLT